MVHEPVGEIAEKEAALPMKLASSTRGVCVSSYKIYSIFAATRPTHMGRQYSLANAAVSNARCCSGPRLATLLKSHALARIQPIARPRLASRRVLGCRIDDSSADEALLCAHHFEAQGF